MFIKHHILINENFCQSLDQDTYNLDSWSNGLRKSFLISVHEFVSVVGHEKMIAGATKDPY